jgi:S-adenosylmethionine/arginine decarboxylase-like enzyme
MWVECGSVPFSGKLGHHWIVDAVDCLTPDLHDRLHLEAVLASIPDELGLRRVAEVRSFEHEENGEVTLAGIVLISESHFSLHVRPHVQTLHADLFSCRPFDDRRALDLLKTAYRFTRYREQMIERGRFE